MDLQEININKHIKETIKTIYNEDDVDMFKSYNENTYNAIVFAINSVLAEIANKQIEELKRKIAEDKFNNKINEVIGKLQPMHNINLGII